MYTVTCDSKCQTMKTKMGGLKEAGMQNIIDKINSHAAASGFSTEVVVSTAAQAVSSLAPPDFVDIVVPNCPPGQQSVVSTMTRMQLIMGGTVACEDIDGCKLKPCAAQSTCSDVKSPGTGYSCSPCPAGYGSPVAKDATANATANTQCYAAGAAGAKVPCVSGGASGGTKCMDIDDCDSKPCGSQATCTDVSVTSQARPSPGLDRSPLLTEVYLPLYCCVGALVHNSMFSRMMRWNEARTGIHNFWIVQVLPYKCACVTNYTFTGSTCEQIHPCNATAGLNPCRPIGVSTCSAYDVSHTGTKGSDWSIEQKYGAPICKCPAAVPANALEAYEPVLAFSVHAESVISTYFT